MGDPATPPAQGNLRALLDAALDDLGAQVVHVGTFDYAAIFRERRMRRGDLVAGIDSTSFCNVLPQWDSSDTLVGGGPYVTEPSALDLSSLRPYPFEPHAALIVADLAGPSAPLMPRRVLEAQLARAEKMGFAVRAAFEFEFLLFQETADSLRASGFSSLSQFAPENRCWSGQTAAEHGDLVADLDATLAAAGIDMHGLGVELGPGCFEATLRHVPALRAADDAALFRMFTRAFARKRGLTACFMASAGPQYPGLGGHINLSLHALDGGANLLSAPDAAHGLSDTARAFIAGMIDVVPEAFALCANNVNSYRRFAPGTWAPKTVSWAPWNYAAAVRTVDTPAANTRLEFRLPGADCNPFLSLALMLGAGLDGIERGLTPPAPIERGGPNEIPPGAEPLPRDLVDAAQRLRGSAKATRIFGDAFVEHFATLCEAENAALGRAVSATELQRYLEN